MKDNAPWTDVTGVARENLTVELNFQGEELAEYSERLGIAQRAASKQAKRGQKLAAKAAATSAFQAQYVQELGMIVTLLFRHGSEKIVPYAVWLEVANQGRFGIISRATEYWGRRLIGRIKSNLNLVQFRGKEGDIDYISSKQVYEEYVAGGTTTTGQPIRKRYTKETKWEKRRRRLEYDPQQLASNAEYTRTVSKKPRRRK